MEQCEKPDIAKIIFAGVPILLMLWAASFITLAVLTRDAQISKYGGLAIFILSIPTYGILATKYSKKLGATIDADEEKVRNENRFSENPKKYITKFDIWFFGTFLIAIPIYLFIGQFVFSVESNILVRYAKLAAPIIILLELVLRRLFQKKAEKTSS